MSSKKQLLPLLRDQKKALEEAFDASSIHVWQPIQLKKFLRNIKALGSILDLTSLSVNDVIVFLIEESDLKRIEFLTPRKEILFIWQNVNEYKLLFSLRPKGYFTHLSALYFNGLINKEPKSIYFNNEQPSRPVSGTLEQSRIDNSFNKSQRITTARTDYFGRNLYLLNGKHTGNYGTMSINVPAGVDLIVSDLERTLIDIVVRPAYSGGVNSILQAYRLAQPIVSIKKLALTLRALQYSYPYHQSIGFYIDTTGVYDQSACLEFANFAPIEYKFYLDYKINNPAYSEKWKIYYPDDMM